MELKPLKSYPLAAYPTRDAADTQPDLLRRLPARWQRNTLVLAAVASLGTWAVAGGQQPASRVAPAFPHGEGRVSVGGFYTPPYAQIPEDEARQIIIDEAKKAGLTFTADARTIKGVPIQPPIAGEEKPPAVARDIAFDAAEAAHNITVEFVSQQDVVDWKCALEQGTMSSFDTKATAAALQDGLKQKKPEGIYATFYDPLTVNVEANNQNDGKQPTQAKLDTQAREDLRQQVRDFLAWLKAEKVI